MDSIEVRKSRKLSPEEVLKRLERFVSVHRPPEDGPEAAAGQEAAPGANERHRVSDDIIHRLEQLTEALREPATAVDEFGVAQ